jgi:hypothetical protein
VAGQTGATASAAEPAGGPLERRQTTQSAPGHVGAAPPVRIGVIDCSVEQFEAEGMPADRAGAGHFAVVLPLLGDMGLEPADISGEARMGQIDLANTDLLIIRRLTAGTRAALAENATVLAEFVAGGGTILQETPTDQEQQVVDWLPEPLGVMITNRDFSVVYVEDPGHPLFTTPNLLSGAEIQQICQQADAAAVAPAGGGAAALPATSPVSWESYQAFRNAKLLVTSRQQGGREADVPAAGFVEFEHGDGRILLTSMRLFGAYAAPGSDLSRDAATWFMENVVNYARLVRAGQAPPVEPRVTFPW